MLQFYCSHVHTHYSILSKIYGGSAWIYNQFYYNTSSSKHSSTEKRTSILKVLFKFLQNEPKNMSFETAPVSPKLKNNYRRLNEHYIMLLYLNLKKSVIFFLNGFFLAEYY